MAHSENIKDRATSLRQKGYSLKEIAQIMNISKSTSSIWMRHVPISPTGISRMETHQTLNRYKMSLKWRQVNIDKKSYYHNLALPIVNNIKYTQPINKLLCAILFWTEGSKTKNHVAFTNSDPTMIKTFLRLLRSSFKIDENKFRVCVHLHRSYATPLIFI